MIDEETTARRRGRRGASLRLGRRRPGQAPNELHFALVPKNMNNPFFDQARDGCKKAESESWPASSSASISAPASTAAARSRSRSSRT